MVIQINFQLLFSYCKNISLATCVACAANRPFSNKFPKYTENVKDVCNIVSYHGVQPKIHKKWSLREAAHCQNPMKPVLEKSIICSVGSNIPC